VFIMIHTVLPFNDDYVDLLLLISQLKINSQLGIYCYTVLEM